MVAIAMTPIPIRAVAVNASLKTGNTILGSVNQPLDPMVEKLTKPMGMATR